MTTAPTPMPKLPWPGQKVRWRNPQQARGYGWEEVFGAGPFDVVRLVDHSEDRLATGLVLRTKLGEWEIDEVWLAMADDGESDTSSKQSADETACLVRSSLSLSLPGAPS